jgi:hypothetical protein
MQLGAVLMTEEEKRLNWEVSNVRESISRLWNNLASTNLTADQRKAATENLSICIVTLRDLLDRQK